jgi:hypothetical protein
VPILTLPKVGARARNELLKDRGLCELSGLDDLGAQASICAYFLPAPPVSDHIVGLWKKYRQRVPKAIELKELRHDLS